VSTAGGTNAHAQTPHAHGGTFAVYWRAAGLHEWRLHRTCTSPGAAERERALLYWTIIAGWRVDETLVRQYPPGRAAAQCLLLEELPTAPPLQAHNPLGPPFTKEAQLARAAPPRPA